MRCKKSGYDSLRACKSRNLFPAAMRVAVITGGAKRIGANIVTTLLDDGWAVIVHCNRSITQARHLIQRGEGAVVSGDLSEDEDLFRVIEEIHDHDLVKEHGGIDLVIERKYLNSTIGTLLSVMLKKSETQAKKETTNVITIDQSLQSAS